MVDQSLIDQITMGERRRRAEGDEFVLDNASIPAASVQATDTSRFEGKVTFENKANKRTFITVTPLVEAAE